MYSVTAIVHREKWSGYNWPNQLLICVSKWLITPRVTHRSSCWHLGPFESAASDISARYMALETPASGAERSRAIASGGINQRQNPVLFSRWMSIKIAILPRLWAAAGQHCHLPKGEIWKEWTQAMPVWFVRRFDPGNRLGGLAAAGRLHRALPNYEGNNGPIRGWKKQRYSLAGHMWASALPLPAWSQYSSRLSTKSTWKRWVGCEGWIGRVPAGRGECVFVGKKSRKSGPWAWNTMMLG